MNECLSEYCGDNSVQYFQPTIFPLNFNLSNNGDEFCSVPKPSSVDENVSDESYPESIGMENIHSFMLDSFS